MLIKLKFLNRFTGKERMIITLLNKIKIVSDNLKQMNIKILQRVIIMNSKRLM